MRRGLLRLVATSLLVPVAAWGCGGSDPERPETTPVRGTVSYKGSPVTKGTITFQSDQGHTATGEIGPDGTYSLSTFGPGDGAVPGHHRVMIVSNTADPGLIPGSSPGYKPPQDLVPKKYANLQSSGLEATVTKGGEPIDFPLE